MLQVEGAGTLGVQREDVVFEHDCGVAHSVACLDHHGFHFSFVCFGVLTLKNISHWLHRTKAVLSVHQNGRSNIMVVGVRLAYL